MWDVCGAASFQRCWSYCPEAELGLEPATVWPQTPGLWDGGAGGKVWMSSLLWGCERLAKCYWILRRRCVRGRGRPNLHHPPGQLWEGSQAEPGSIVRRGGQALICLLPSHQSLPSRFGGRDAKREGEADEQHMDSVQSAGLGGVSSRVGGCFALPCPALPLPWQDVAGRPVDQSRGRDTCGLAASTTSFPHLYIFFLSLRPLGPLSQTPGT